MFVLWELILSKIFAMKKLKYTLTVLLISILTLITYYQVKKSTVKQELVKQNLFSNIKQAPQLPGTIIHAYNKMYPHSYFERAECPCNNILFFQFNNSRLDKFLATKILEENVTRSQCINAYLANFDFTHNSIGIERASIFFFKKKLNQLSVENSIKLIIMLKNPSIYNPITHLKELNEVYKQYINDI